MSNQEPAINWDLTDAENHLNDVLSRAAAEGPQTISRQNEHFIVLPQAEYDRLAAQRPSFKDWLLNGPSLTKVEVSRDRSAMRESEL